MAHGYSMSFPDGFEQSYQFFAGGGVLDSLLPYFTGPHDTYLPAFACQGACSTASA